jgi:hypothetical protein
MLGIFAHGARKRLASHTQAKLFVFEHPLRGLRQMRPVSHSDGNCGLWRPLAQVANCGTHGGNPGNGRFENRERSRLVARRK